MLDNGFVKLTPAIFLNFMSLQEDIPKFVNLRKEIGREKVDGRVGLRRQIKVLVRKGVGSNPTLNNVFFFRLIFHP
ncbi:hypothetical protein D0Y65_033738, partial [Glycine soja]